MAKSLMSLAEEKSNTFIRLTSLNGEHVWGISNKEGRWYQYAFKFRWQAEAKIAEGNRLLLVYPKPLSLVVPKVQA
jgi:hypothetical protein